MNFCLVPEQPFELESLLTRLEKRLERKAQAVIAHFKACGVEMIMRYFDPSYQIRGCPANTEDSLICDRMDRHAAHAAMSGRTGLVVSYLNSQFVHVPIDLIATGGKRLDLDGELWSAVLSVTW